MTFSTEWPDPRGPGKPPRTRETNQNGKCIYYVTTLVMLVVVVYPGQGYEPVVLVCLLLLLSLLIRSSGSFGEMNTYIAH